MFDSFNKVHKGSFFKFLKSLLECVIDYKKNMFLLCWGYNWKMSEFFELYLK